MLSCGTQGRDAGQTLDPELLTGADQSLAMLAFDKNRVATDRTVIAALALCLWTFACIGVSTNDFAVSMRRRTCGCKESSKAVLQQENNWQCTSKISWLQYLVLGLGPIPSALTASALTNALLKTQSAIRHYTFGRKYLDLEDYYCEHAQENDIDEIHEPRVESHPQIFVAVVDMGKAHR
jgi:hypothetical protein